MWQRAVTFVVGVVIPFVLAPGSASAEQTLKLTDEAIETLSTNLARIGDTQRATVYFDVPPTPDLKALLEAQGFNVSVTPRPGAVPSPVSPPAGSPLILGLPAAGAGFPYAPLAMREPDRKELIRDFLRGTRAIASELPADSGLELDGITIDLPAGSIHFRLR